jgi:hypothetical protein
VFCYTSWHFCAFFGTNLLTRCHSASSLFSTVFVFQESYTGNILEIGQNKARTSYFSRTQDEDRRRARGVLGTHHTRGWSAPLGRARGWCGVPGRRLTPPLRLYKAFQRWNPKSIGVFPEKFRSATAVEDKFRGGGGGGIEVSVSAPSQDGEVPPEPSPSTLSPPPPSPSTSPPSPSTLLSPMMRRE